MKLSKEDKITRWFAEQSGLDTRCFPIGIGDDMAQILLEEDVSVLITTDMLLDGVHFHLKECGMTQAGYKAMAVNLSDCAAMASVPLCAVAAVALPKGYGNQELKELWEGITSAGRPFFCPIVGGDITTWKKQEPFAITITMISRPGTKPPVRRNGAQVGDCVCVTGTLGGSLDQKHLIFVPRVKEALELVRLSDIHSMIDISDGLSTDLSRICSQSNVGAMIEEARIPISLQAKEKSESLASALHDGEDFELLFTLPPNGYKNLMQEWTLDTPLTCIGEITDSRILELKNNQGNMETLNPGGYDHI